MSRLALFVAALLAVATVPLATSPSFAATAPMSPTPVKGQCYLVDEAELTSNYPVSSPVACSQLHTAEVWKVGRWPANRNPYTLTDSAIRSIANKQCNGPDFPVDAFNYWAFYVPSRAAWNSGQRWLRCDAMKIKLDGAGNFKTIYWWRGRSL